MITGLGLILDNEAGDKRFWDTSDMEPTADGAGAAADTIEVLDNTGPYM